MARRKEHAVPANTARAVHVRCYPQQFDAIDAAVRSSGMSQNTFCLLAIRAFVIDQARGGNLARTAFGELLEEWPMCVNLSQLPIQWEPEQPLLRKGF